MITFIHAPTVGEDRLFRYTHEAICATSITIRNDRYF
jgi:hypothetical protein